MFSNKWRPSASMMALKERASLYRKIREYFDEQDVLEVETQMLSSAATVDVYIDSFCAEFRPIGQSSFQTYYLHTSPEFAMKRLLAAGSGDIYSMGRVFRNGEAGGMHNPEFTMLEWYRIGMDQQQLMDDITDLLSAVSSFQEIARRSYRSLFEEMLGVNPHIASVCELRKLAAEKVDKRLTSLDRNDCLDLLFSKIIEPTLKIDHGNGLSGVFVYDYPASMAALARIKKNNRGYEVAARFELFVNGVEVANAYEELLDSHEQLDRFKSEQKKRRERGFPVYPFDQSLVDALAYGMPDCSGVSLGIDRLLMLLLNVNMVSDVVAFDFNRA